MSWRRLICKLIGHDDREALFSYWGTGPWCSDEKCARCGERRWWPQ